VTPGDPNRLREQPSLRDSAIVGQIPGGGAFDVLSGPVCDPQAGIVWWQVRYNDMTGWTAESGESQYYTEPAG
jgi:hypothetical protein